MLEEGIEGMFDDVLKWLLKGVHASGLTCSRAGSMPGARVYAIEWVC